MAGEGSKKQGGEKKGKKGGEEKKRKDPKPRDMIKSKINKQASRKYETLRGTSKYKLANHNEQKKMEKEAREQAFRDNGHDGEAGYDRAVAAASAAAVVPAVAAGVVAGVGVGGGVAGGLVPAPIPPHQLGGGGEEDADWDLVDDDDEYLIARLSELQEQGDNAVAGRFLEALVALYPTDVDFDIFVDITHRILAYRMSQ